MANDYRSNDRNWQAEQMRKRCVNHSSEEKKARRVNYYKNQRIDIPEDISPFDRTMYGRVFSNYLREYSEEKADLAARYYLAGRKIKVSEDKLYSFVNGCMIANSKGYEGNGILGFGVAYASALKRGKTNEEAEIFAASKAGMKATEKITRNVTMKRMRTTFGSIALATVLMVSVGVKASKVIPYISNDYMNTSVQAGLDAMPKNYHNGPDFNANTYWYEATDAVANYDAENMNLEEYIYGIYNSVDTNRSEVMDGVIRGLSSAGYLPSDVNSWYDYCFANGWVKVVDNEVQVDANKMVLAIQDQVKLKNQLMDLKQSGKSK